MKKDKLTMNIPSSEITPKQTYIHRRDFIKSTGLLAGSMLLSACGINPKSATKVVLPTSDPSIKQRTDELGNPVNALEDITGYNNYYEFSTDKESVAKLSGSLITSPWEIEVFGLVNKPGKISVADLEKKYQPEERIYRLRCVEAWSMVIPWMGFSLSKLLQDVEPTSDAKYVRFETLFDPDVLPGQQDRLYPWPYQEGLRMDEAMHPLTILATGLYGGELPAQNGGGVRLVVPWKYGFKSIKSIVKIELVDYEPSTMWSSIASNEYGFYANVNPTVDHPRWSQGSERLIGELDRRPTLMFNGYEEQVAPLYKGMDLSKFY